MNNYHLLIFSNRRGDIWWPCIRHDGQKIQCSLETEDKKLAKDVEAKIRAEIVEGKYFDKLVGCKKSFDDLINKFMREYAPTVSKNMQEAYKYYRKNLKKFFGNPGLIALTSDKIASYKLHRRDQGASASTINRELFTLSKAFNLAVKEWKWLKENPVSNVSKEPENNERDRWLTEDEERKLITNCPEWLKDIILFALHTGLRQDELLSLEWSRVNLFNKTVIIQKTKNKKPKTIPLNQTALTILVNKEQLKSIKNDLVFISSHGTKIDRFNLRRAFNKALRKARIEDFRWHDLRHTFASRLVQKGEDL